MSSTRKSKLLKNTAIIGFGSLFAKGISFVLLPFYTIYLSPSQYGTLDLITSYIAYIAPIFTLQLEWALFRFLIDARGDSGRIKAIISNVLYVVVPILTVVSLAAILLNLYVDSSYILPSAALVVSTVLLNLSLQCARGLGKNKQYAIASILSAVTLAVLFFVFVVLMGMGLIGVLLASAVAAGVACGYIFFSVRLYRYLDISARDAKLQKQLLGYATPLIPEIAAWWVVNVSDRTIITWVLGAAANGIYAVANKYALIFNVIFGIFHMSWTEQASIHINDKDRDSFFSDIHNSALWLFGSLGLLMIAVCPLVFPLIINQEFSDALLYIPILVIANLFYALASIYGAIYVAKRKTRQIARTTIIASIVNIAINLVLIHLIGVFAAALSTLVGYLMLAAYRHFDTQKYVSINYNKRTILSLGLLYIYSLTLYYLGDKIGSVISTTTITLFLAIFNRRYLLSLKQKLGG